MEKYSGIEVSAAEEKKGIKIWDVKGTGGGTYNREVIDIPPEDIIRIDGQGVEYKHPDGHRASARWDLRFIHEALDFVNKKEFNRISVMANMPREYFDWSFIRDSDEEVIQEMVKYIKTLKGFKDMKKLGLTSAEKV